jgi:hypothetical protein
VSIGCPYLRRSVVGLSSGPWEASLGLLVSRMSLPEEECGWWALGGLAGTACE